MSIVVGDSFEDFGNTEECVFDSVPAYEILEGGLIRLFVCKTIHGHVVLDHTDIVTRTMLISIGKRLLEIADEVERMPASAVRSEGKSFH